MFGIIEDRQILTPASAFSLLRYVLVVEVFEEYLASHRYVPKKREEYFNNFQIIIGLL